MVIFLLLPAIFSIMKFREVPKKFLPIEQRNRLHAA
jgi:hypothetical protein